MLGMKKPSQAVRSVIGADVRISGRCTFQGSLQVDGCIVGDVVADEGSASTLRIGESGRVEGAVQGDHISVGGTIIGPVLARDRLELLPTARIEGDVRYRMLEMQPGAVVAGQLQPQATPPRVEPVAGGTAPAVADAPLAEPTLDPDRL